MNRRERRKKFRQGCFDVLLEAIPKCTYYRLQGVISLMDDAFEEYYCGNLEKAEYKLKEVAKYGHVEDMCEEES